MRVKIQEEIDNMDKESVTNILEYSKLSKMLDKVEDCIKENKLKEAYAKAAALLEYINIVVLIKQFKIKVENTNIANIIKLYSDYDRELFIQMISINAEYNEVDINNPDIDDIDFLLLKIDYIVEYVTGKYGRIFS